MSRPGEYQIKMGLRLMDPLDWFSVDRDYDVTLDLRDQLYREHPELCLVDTGPEVRFASPTFSHKRLLQQSAGLCDAAACTEATRECCLCSLQCRACCAGSSWSSVWLTLAPRCSKLLGVRLHLAAV